jgi:DNA transformation protein
MFGGAGVYADGVMFALVADGAIFLKADEANTPDFEREGLPPFQYQTKNGSRAVMSYWRMPERLYDDPDELAQWAARALAAAHRQKRSAARPRRATAAQAKPTAKPKPKSKTGMKR